MNAIISATTILTAISVILLVLLLIIYIRNLKQVKSKLLVGLLIFTALFLITNLTSLAFYISMQDFYAPGIEWHVFILSLLQTIAFSIMLYISWD